MGLSYCSVIWTQNYGKEETWISPASLPGCKFYILIKIFLKETITGTETLTPMHLYDTKDP